MLELKKFIFNSFQVNTLVLFDESKECVIIDPANYSEEENMELLGYVETNNLKPVLQLNTHCHIDHILGINFVKNHFGIPVCAHEKEIGLINNAKLMGDLYGFEVDPLPRIDNYISDNQLLKFGNSELHAIHVPGHSEGSLAYYAAEGSLVICGDALFAGSIGRTDLPGGDFDTLITSIETRLFTLPDETVVWPGHGPSSTILNEKENNPFFNNYKT
ncbi:MBL fold metallo-hydrolase [Bacteroidota bacterium]